MFGKFGKSSEISESGFPECLESSKISEIVIFRTFRNLWKNDVKPELRKSRKTRSDSKTDSKVRLKVRNAGPYWKCVCDWVSLLLCKTVWLGKLCTCHYKTYFWERQWKLKESWLLWKIKHYFFVDFCPKPDLNKHWLIMSLNGGKCGR